MNTAPEPFQVYAIRYATVERTEAENFIDGDPHERGMHMDYFVWVAISTGRTWVIDTGFNRAAAGQRNRTFLRCPAQSLQLLGVDAATVEDVIVTHLHYDHIGNFDLFPAARFHLQDREMAFATGRRMRERFYAGAYAVDDVVGMVRKVYAGRVEFHDGDTILAPNLSLHLIGGHTRGLQVVRLWTARGWLLLASDASHYFANMQQGRPFPIVADIAEMVEGWDTLRALVDDPARIIPGHDPAVLQLFPPPAPELAGIIARLD